MSSRVRVELSGAVQGVGFRPFVYGLATRLGLRGFVVNTAKGLRIELEGDEQEIAEFMTELSVRRPPLAVVADTRVQALAVSGTERFEIRASVPGAGRTVLVSPDYATCAECLLELLDPNDRRFRYPFINCTNCGPRYTIVKDVPYDRSRTTMADFELCTACRAEYEDPANRRFHAEPTCCPVCGPQVWLTDSSGRRLEQHDPVEASLTLLAEGKILAVKGLGGFHLACDAASEQAVTTLRQRKRRAEKPFAVMVRDE